MTALRNARARVPKGPLARTRWRLSRPPARGEGLRIAGAFAVAAVALAVAPAVDWSPPAPLGGAGVAPNFTVDTVAGAPYELAADLGARPILLEFLHPDCSHCQAVAPTLAAAHGEYGGRVRFVSVAIRLGGFAIPTQETVGAFAATYGHAWTYGIDRGTAARDAYHVTGTPLFFFIHANGTVMETWPGEIAPGPLSTRLAALVGG